MMQNKIYNDEAIQEELNEIYSQYHNTIKIYIGQLEVIQNKFPIEILNEIRAIFTHIAKIYVSNDINVANANLKKAKGHIKRAQLDAYKYMCYAFEKKYKDFRELYKNVDLSNINNGDFLLKLTQKYVMAEKKSIDARLKEATSNDSLDAYEAYEEAYNEYATLYLLIKDNMAFVEKLQQKEVLQQQEFDEKYKKLYNGNQELQETIIALKKENKKEKAKSTAFTIISFVLGLVSIVFGILQFI